MNQEKLVQKTREIYEEFNDIFNNESFEKTLGRLEKLIQKIYKLGYDDAKNDYEAYRNGYREGYNDALEKYPKSNEKVYED